MPLFRGLLSAGKKTEYKKIGRPLGRPIFLLI